MGWLDLLKTPGNHIHLHLEFRHKRQGKASGCRTPAGRKPMAVPPTLRFSLEQQKQHQGSALPPPASSKLFANSCVLNTRADCSTPGQQNSILLTLPKALSCPCRNSLWLILQPCRAAVPCTYSSLVLVQMLQKLFSIRAKWKLSCQLDSFAQQAGLVIWGCCSAAINCQNSQMWGQKCEEEKLSNTVS